MSKERDIDDILDSLNQLLREGESHNDDHVETDEQVREIEGELHELEEDDREAEEAASEVLDTEAAEAEPGQVEDGVDSSSEASNEISSDYLDDLNDDHSEALSEEEEEYPIEASISVQRVVLTEAMLVNNPQGNLLSTVKENREADVEQVAESEPAEHETAGTVQEESSDQNVVHETHGSNVDDFPSGQQLAQLVEKVSDDVISQLQQELPSLFKASLHRCFSEIRDAEQRDTKQPENHSEE